MGVNDMSPILGIVNEITMENFDSILEELEFDQVLNAENLERITKEESPTNLILRLETRNQITLMITIPKAVKVISELNNQLNDLR
jgi:hypothetical protein